MGKDMTIAKTASEKNAPRSEPWSPERIVLLRATRMNEHTSSAEFRSATGVPSRATLFRSFRSRWPR